MGLGRSGWNNVRKRGFTYRDVAIGQCGNELI
jgi:hypothetical protein